MKNRIQAALLIATSCLATLGLVILLGASSPHQEAPRYDADFDTILGGIGGLTVEITDHEQQKAFLYVIPMGKQDDEDAQPTAQLVATIDLTSAGDDVLQADMSGFEK